MNEIKCDNCGKVFKVDESGFEYIKKQIRDSEFERELKNREAQLTALKAAQMEKDLEALRSQIKEQNALFQTEKAKNETTIVGLNEKLKQQKLEDELKTKEITSEMQRQQDHLKNVIESKDRDTQLLEKSLKEQHETEKKAIEKELEYYKELKTKQSIKIVGENLEQHCEIEFNKMRATAFKNAYFKKDNDARDGSKGDYIFRDYDDAKNEIVSIMFDMKDEQDATATKKTNESFMKELDKDRTAKKCEYAVLVSRLERDNDFYNSGIADVSFHYDKMYVVRPQSFIAIITLLRDQALKTVKARGELEVVKKQNIDITNFENDLNEWKEKWKRDGDLMGKSFLKAVDEIEKGISNLHKAKEDLLISAKHLGHANDKVDGLTIQRLTCGNPTMAEAFANIKKTKKDSRGTA